MWGREPMPPGHNTMPWRLNLQLHAHSGQSHPPRKQWPHIPPPLRAYQTREIVTDLAHRIHTNFSGSYSMDLDYYIETAGTTSGTSIYSTKYNPRIVIDILRASMPTYPGYSTPLSSDFHDHIWIWMEDLAEHPPNTL